MTSSNEFSNLSERVRKLESQNRRWKFGTIVLALVFGSALTMAMAYGQTQRPSALRARTIDTENLILRSANGQELGRISAASGSGMIELFNANGHLIFRVPGPFVTRGN